MQDCTYTCIRRLYKLKMNVPCNRNLIKRAKQCNIDIKLFLILILHLFLNYIFSLLRRSNNFCGSHTLTLTLIDLNLLSTKKPKQLSWQSWQLRKAKKFLRPFDWWVVMKIHILTALKIKWSTKHMNAKYNKLYTSIYKHCFFVCLGFLRHFGLAFLSINLGIWTL